MTWTNVLTWVAAEKFWYLKKNEKVWEPLIKCIQLMEPGRIYGLVFLGLFLSKSSSSRHLQRHRGVQFLLLEAPGTFYHLNSIFLYSLTKTVLPTSLLLVHYHVIILLICLSLITHFTELPIPVQAPLSDCPHTVTSCRIQLPEEQKNTISNFTVSKYVYEQTVVQTLLFSLNLPLFSQKAVFLPKFATKMYFESLICLQIEFIHYNIHYLHQT